jgi:hypothetical protein
MAEGEFVQKLKYGHTFIHHGLERQESRRGSGGVGIILSEKATADWKRGGGLTKGGAVGGGMTRCMALRLDLMKSNSNSATKLMIANAYFPDSTKEDSLHELMCNKFTELIVRTKSNDFVSIGADTNASIGTIKSRSENSEEDPD